MFIRYSMVDVFSISTPGIQYSTVCSPPRPMLHAKFIYVHLGAFGVQYAPPIAAPRRTLAGTTTRGSAARASSAILAVRGLCVYVLSNLFLYFDVNMMRVCLTLSRPDSTFCSRDDNCFLVAWLHFASALLLNPSWFVSTRAPASRVPNALPLNQKLACYH